MDERGSDRRNTRAEQIRQDLYLVFGQIPRAVTSAFLLQLCQRILCPAPGDGSIAEGEERGLQSGELKYQRGDGAGEEKQGRGSHETSGERVNEGDHGDRGRKSCSGPAGRQKNSQERTDAQEESKHADSQHQADAKLQKRKKNFSRLATTPAAPTAQRRLTSSWPKTTSCRRPAFLMVSPSLRSSTTSRRRAS